jgi:hypothetical protein
LFLFFKKKNIVWDPLCWFCLVFSISMFLVIGYTVPIIGAFVRYRSIYFILLLIPLACNVDWKKLSGKLNIKINNI